ncbi:MAG TPA: thymidine phosphorylase [Vulgatibacter sp.]|nr:thymidine phosphorylase [Vulgatibacter sp.]
MRAYELILRKRDGGRLTPSEIEWFLGSYTKGEIPDYQASALLMAIFFRGLDDGELAAWTAAMLESGDRLDLSDVPGIKVDKHSTGGVGDKVSIPLVPLMIACGVPVPMIAGRGLGHTGGTVDKLESIPGFRTDLDVAAFRRQLGELGGAIIGQTERLAPADRKLYALRDATATVESIPLIASSIMSKKLAEGCDGLVLDVKVGAGAFMKDLESARLLAGTMIEIGARMGRRMSALVTRMDEPLGATVGNALEVRESIDLLRGEGPADLEELTVELGAEMLVLAGATVDADEGRAAVRSAIASGRGLEAFARLVAAQGGDPRVAEDPTSLPAAPRIVPIPAPRAGFVGGIRADEVGLAAVVLGAGRSRKEDAIDPAVGFVLHKKVGDPVDAGESIGLAHVGGRPGDRAALERVAAAFTIADEAPPRRPLILERMSR